MNGESSHNATGKSDWLIEDKMPSVGERVPTLGLDSKAKEEG